MDNKKAQFLSINMDKLGFFILNFFNVIINSITIVTPYRKIKACINASATVTIIGATFKSIPPPVVEINGSTGSLAGDARRLMKRSHLLDFIGKSGIST
ncbi:hypothetical protein ACFVSW_14830 [Neobacillus sp. NPDC058068]|uniref:hypothetical protein n=1 Tax=Neobacillus sp. NPDC058068 TaxID=3346325 RepID=UPI0036D8707B